jgi:hypothetical protein
MKFFLRYLALEGKKSLIAARKSIVKFIVMLLLIAGGVLAVSLVMSDAGVFQTAEIGVVIPEDENQTKMVAQFISNMDSVKSVCHFQYLDQKSALDALGEGSLDAVLSLPEQFYEDVDSGKNTPATIYFPENAPLNTRVFGELVTDGVSLLRTAEAGVYAAYDTAGIYKAELTNDQIGDVIPDLYIYEAFDRTLVFQKSVYSSLGKADLYQYYFSAGVLILLLMLGVNQSHLYQRQSRAVENKIRIYGIGEGKNALVKLFLMTIPLWLAGTIIYVAGCAVSKQYHLSFLWFDREVLAGTLLLAAVIAAYFHLVYTISGESTRGTVVLLAVNMLQVIASGIVIPTAYLPKLFEKIAPFFPLTFWDNYYLKLLFFGIDARDTKLLFLMLFGFLGVSVIWAKVSSLRKKGDEKRRKSGGSLSQWKKPQILTWYQLQLKAWLKRGTSLLLLAAMLLVVWLAGQISIPQSDNVMVGVVSTEGAHGKEVLEHLKERESIFSFVEYDSRETLLADLVAGKLECGFYFSQNFEKKFEHEKLKNSVSYVCTPLTTKGEVARETFYAALFEVYGRQMLSARAEQLFGENASAAESTLLENNEKYLAGSEVFQVNVEQTKAVETVRNTAQKVFPIHGLVAVFLFFIMFVEYGRRFDAGEGKPYLALPAPMGDGFQIMGLLAAGTVPAVLGTVMVCSSGESRGVLIEVTAMCLLLVICALWIAFAGKWIRSMTGFTSQMFLLLLINLVFCPVFVDISAYIPAFEIVRCLFPTGLYLEFC